MPAQPWDAEHPVDRALCRALVGARFPDLRGQELVRIGAGWDNDMWRVGPVAFRFPRRALGVDLLSNELRALPALRRAAELPAPYPEITHRGEPSAPFPHPWFGYPWLAGIPGDRATIVDRRPLAADLGAFLAALHAVDPTTGSVPPTPRADMARRTAISQPGLRAIAGAFPELARAAGEALAALPPNAPPEQRVFLHGDLYSRNLLVDGNGGLAGVIDWGDVAEGDPAVDLSVAWSTLPAAARPAFFAAYGPVDAATRSRARHFAIGHQVMLLAYAIDIEDSGLVAEGARAVARAVTTER